MVNANTTSLLSIQKITPIYVDFTVPENDLDRVRLNLDKGPLKVVVHTPDNPAKDIDGEVTFLDNAVQDGTGTVKLARDRLQSGPRFVAGAVCQYSTHPRDAQIREARSQRSSPDRSAGTVRVHRR